MDTLTQFLRGNLSPNAARELYSDGSAERQHIDWCERLELGPPYPNMLEAKTMQKSANSRSSGLE
jgi:hypothetical protein